MSRRLALLDLDDTLIDRRGAFRRWAEDFLRRRGLWSRAALAAMLEADGSGLQRRELMLQRVLERLPLRKMLEELTVDYDTRVPSFFDPAPLEVLEGLDALRAAGYIVGLCTNGYHEGGGHGARAAPRGVVHDRAARHLESPGGGVHRRGGSARGTLEGAWMVGDGAPTDIEASHEGSFV